MQDSDIRVKFDFGFEDGVFDSVVVRVVDVSEGFDRIVLDAPLTPLISEISNRGYGLRQHQIILRKLSEISSQVRLALKGTECVKIKESDFES